MSRTNKAMSNYYNGPFYQTGGGLMDWINKGATWLKDNQVISKADQIAKMMGIAPTDPRYELVMNIAKQKGYGRRKKTKAKGKTRSRK